jgi:hypothetical protein
VAFAKAGYGFRSSRPPEADQAYTEYGLILVLVGITVIGALTIMGHTSQPGRP